jgi:hypothetical protein
MPLEDILADDEGGMEAATPGVPQGDTEAIARRLLGDDLVNRYGDVIGARSTTAADVLRDFTVGFHNGPAKVDELKMKVAETYRDSYVKAQRSALAKAKIDADNVKSILDVVKTVQGLPPGHRTAVFTEHLDALGIPYSKAAVKMFLDADMTAQLPLDELAAAADNGDLKTSDVAGVMGTGLNAAKFLGEVSRRQRDRQATGNMILDAERKRLSIQDAAARFQERQATADARAQKVEDDARKRKLGLKKDRLSIEKSKQSLAKGANAGAGSLTGDPVLDAALGGAAAPRPTAAPVGIKAITQVK